ncbi:MAG: class I SAM-dependent methyltransferase [Chloroflexota bacterium]|jgi:ubiquinone/menaquinone biosynthesis C-methylase UbiE
MRPAQSHFANVANQYASFRPTYAPELLQALVALTGHQAYPAPIVALDIAAGSGQATVPLAEYAQTVIASDLALNQIASMPYHPRIHRYVARAELSGLPDYSVDLITVAQSMHWFDVDAFHHEVYRILKPNGLIAVWTYALLSGTPELTDIIHRLYNYTAAWWPADRAHVDNHYANLAFPYQRIDFIPPPMVMHYTLEQLLGYLRTWSGVQRYLKDQGHDPVALFVDAFTAAWPISPTTPTLFTFDLTIFVGKPHPQKQ